MTSTAVEFLAAYDWPGNVRELKNVIIEAGAALMDRQVSGSTKEITITPTDLRECVRRSGEDALSPLLLRQPSLLPDVSLRRARQLSTKSQRRLKIFLDCGCDGARTESALSLKKGGWSAFLKDNPSLKALIEKVKGKQRDQTPTTHSTYKSPLGIAPRGIARYVPALVSLCLLAAAIFVYCVFFHHDAGRLNGGGHQADTPQVQGIVGFDYVKNQLPRSWTGARLGSLKARLSYAASGSGVGPIPPESVWTMIVEAPKKPDVDPGYVAVKVLDFPMGRKGRITFRDASYSWGGQRSTVLHLLQNGEMQLVEGEDSISIEGREKVGVIVVCGKAIFDSDSLAYPESSESREWYLTPLSEYTHRGAIRSFFAVLAPYQISLLNRFQTGTVAADNFWFHDTYEGTNGPVPISYTNFENIISEEFSGFIQQARTKVRTNQSASAVTLADFVGPRYGPAFELITNKKAREDAKLHRATDQRMETNNVLFILSGYPPPR
jgi:hypothetical protein